MESQMEVQKGRRRTGTRDGALFCQGFLQAALGLKPVVRQRVAFWR